MLDKQLENLIDDTVADFHGGRRLNDEELEPLDGDEVDEIAEEFRKRLNKLNGNI